MKYLGEVVAFIFLFIFVALLTPTFVQKVSVTAGFTAEEALVLPFLPWIFLGSMVSLFAVIIVKRRNE